MLTDRLKRSKDLILWKALQLKGCIPQRKSCLRSDCPSKHYSVEIPHIQTITLYPTGRVTLINISHEEHTLPKLGKPLNNNTEIVYLFRFLNNSKNRNAYHVAREPNVGDQATIDEHGIIAQTKIVEVFPPPSGCIRIQTDAQDIPLAYSRERWQELVEDSIVQNREVTAFQGESC